ncbi:adenylyl-sulfate kinase [Enterovibrio makurazakiensis]|uniref:Adenylyl-sulfate kinase n=1 Tax=Enterovibrio gelatinilyticus TaxID=2899819 RepID=A0ABT5R0P8_9GAMM|nr:adenylyl-sulfate kinase [Enterovibrio sp. ZSDZ42]MDD1793853.1 adenylyl-sulfate kinase [Enterovibrio sp. ZSDZ42]
MSALDSKHTDENVVWHRHAIDKDFRAEQKKQRPALLWFTGLSGSGKSTVAGALENKLAELGYHTYLLDGDNVRHGLCRDLGFSDHDRRENIRRVGEVAKLMTDAGLIVLSAFISPFREERQLVRELLPDGEFLEVYVDTPLDVCESRDPKGLYKKARAGEIKAFTGISSAYEAPESPEIHLHTDQHEVDAIVEQCLITLRKQGVIA